MTKSVQLNPDDAWARSNLAWEIVACPEEQLRDAKKAAEHAKQAMSLDADPLLWRTLGTAQYRAGDLQDAVTSLKQSIELRNGDRSYDWFVLAMACWKMDGKEEARQCYTKAVAWMESNATDDELLLRFRAEAEALIGIGEPSQSQTDVQVANEG